MRILVEEGKNGNSYYDASDNRKLHNVCCRLLKERLSDGYYENSIFIKNALDCIETVKSGAKYNPDIVEKQIAYRLLLIRNRCEYEYVELEDVIDVD